MRKAYLEKQIFLWLHVDEQYVRFNRSKFSFIIFFCQWLIKNNLKQNKSIVHFSRVLVISYIGTCRSTRKIKKIWIFAIDLGPFGVNLTECYCIFLFSHLSLSLSLSTLFSIRVKEFLKPFIIHGSLPPYNNFNITLLLTLYNLNCNSAKF